MPAAPMMRRPVLVAAAALLTIGQVLVTPAPASLAEGTQQDKIAEREQIDQQLEDLQIELNDVDAELADTYLALAETELLIPQAQQTLDDARAELAAAEEEDRLTGDRLQAAQEEEQRLTGQVDEGQLEVDRSDEELAQVALEAYKGGGAPNPASVYVGSEQPQDAVDRSVNYRLTLASQGSRLDGLRTQQSVTENSADRLSAVRAEIDDLKAQAEAAVERTTAAEASAADAKAELDGLYDRQTQQRDDLEASKARYQDDEAALEARGSALDTEIEELARQEKERELARQREQEQQRQQEEQEREEQAASGGERGSSASASGWLRPLDSRLNSNFGYRVHPIYGIRRLHAGVDFPVACGTPVRATESGRVLQTTYNSGAGNKLILTHGLHDGTLITSSYHHLEGYAVSSGARIERGEVIGYVGTTGSSTGCHLHFEIHEDGSAVDPSGYMD